MVQSAPLNREDALLLTLTLIDERRCLRDVHVFAFGHLDGPEAAREPHDLLGAEAIPKHFDLQEALEQHGYVADEEVTGYGPVFLHERGPRVVSAKSSAY